MPLTIKALKDDIRFLPFGSGEVAVSKKDELYLCADDTAKSLCASGESFAPEGWDIENPPPPPSDASGEDTAFVEGWIAREHANAAIDDAINGEKTPADASDYYKAARAGADLAVAGKKCDDKKATDDFIFAAGYNETKDELDHIAAQEKADKAQAKANEKKAKSANNPKDGQK